MGKQRLSRDERLIQQGRLMGTRDKYRLPRWWGVTAAELARLEEYE